MGSIVLTEFTNSQLASGTDKKRARSFERALLMDK